MIPNDLDSRLKKYNDNIDKNITEIKRIGRQIRILFYIFLIEMGFVIIFLIVLKK